MDLPHNIHELSHEANEAISDVNDFRRRLEDILHSPDDNINLVPLLQQYLGALESAGTRLSAWTEVVNAHSNILDMIPLLVWYASLPCDRYSVLLRNIPSFEGHQSLQIYAHQVLAYTRVTNLHPPLLDHDVTNMPSAPDRSNPWFPSLNPDAFSCEEYKSLCQELKPLSVALKALGSRPTADQTIANITQIRGPASSLLPPLPMSFAGRGPFGSLALVLQDCKDGCRATSLPDFVATLKRHTPKGFEPAVIAQTLNIVYSHQASMLSEALQVLLVRALDEILTWECKAGPGEPCPFSDTDITHLVASLEHNLTHELSLRFAKDTFALSTFRRTPGPSVCSGRTPDICLLASDGESIDTRTTRRLSHLEQDVSKNIYN
ncbi:hypothetical protein C0991_000976 [Blastosporella zonata]|nr:hypothetical protein C0991_000976 [Blastosporella zonata]